MSKSGQSTIESSELSCAEGHMDVGSQAFLLY